jgi:transposase
VIEMVQAGASRREAAEEFSVADSTAVKWLQRWDDEHETLLDLYTCQP